MSMKYRPEIDGLRAFAVIPVIFFHAGFTLFGGGFVGVDVFFVISGYLITAILIQEIQEERFSLNRFYERRARRILPALFFVMATVFFVSFFVLLPRDMEGLGKSLAAVPMFVSNILFWRESGYFSAAAELKPLLHTWSLAIEEQYYLIFPLFLLVGWRFGQGFLAAALIIITLASLALAQWGVSNKPEAAFYLLPTRAWELLIGSLVAFYLSRAGKHSTGLGNVASACGAMLVVYAMFAFDKGTPVPGIYALIPTLGAALIIIFGTRETVVGKFLGHAAFVGIGLISYSAYLWHQPVLALTRHAMEPAAPLLIALCVGVFGLAYLTWRFVEQPFRNAAVISRIGIFQFAIVGSVLGLVCGLYVYKEKGFLNRHLPGDQHLAGLSASDASEYVEKRFNQLRMNDFTGDQQKVLVIGDSFAQDLMNAIYESSLDRGRQFSTHHISSRCGNLYVKQPLPVKPEDRHACEGNDRYENARLRELIGAADYVWLASDWQPWQAQLGKQSMKNLESEFGKKFLVFGTKNFGKVNIRAILSKSESERLTTVNNMDAGYEQTNVHMAKTLSPAAYIDVSELLCNSHNSCRIFLDSGALISHDGGHLTRQGAQFLGSKLQQHPLIPALGQMPKAKNLEEGLISR